MKKVLIMALCFLLLIATDAVAQYKYRDSGGGVSVSADCNVAAYYTIGKLCQDSSTKKVYVGTGDAVAELAAGASGDVTAATTSQTWGDGTGPNVWTFSVTGTDPTITATASKIAIGGTLDLGTNNITTTGSLGATGAGKLTKLWAVDMELTNAPTINGAAWTTILQPIDATLTAIAAQSETAGGLQYFTADNTPANLAIGTAYQVLHTKSDTSKPEYTSTLGATATRLTAGYFTNIYGTGITTGIASNTAGTLNFLNATNANAFTITSGVSGAAIGWTLPTAAPGGANYLLNVDADGTMGYTDPAGLGGGYTNLTSFVDQTAWRVFYSDGSGDLKELALGADGTYLKSNGASSAPTFDTPSGSGTVDVSGTPSNHYWAGWTDADTLKGFSITASKPVCSDANGDPAVCAGTEGVWQVAGSYQTSDAELAAVAGLTSAQGSIPYFTGSGTATTLAKGTAAQMLQMNSGATAPEWTSTLSIIGIDLTAGTFNIPNGTTALNTGAGRIYFNTTSKAFSIGDGSSSYYAPTSLAPISWTTGGTTARVMTLPNADSTLLYSGGALGTPSGGTLTNTTGLPIATGISGLGTNVATALAVNIGSAGAPVVLNGVGGTPSSLNLTNAVTNSGTTLPETCTVGNLFLDTDADTNGSVYSCIATNTWKDIDDDGGEGGMATTDIDTSAELFAITTDETGSASGTPLLVFNQAPRIDNIELGAATDTTIHRESAGVVSIEGATILTNTVPAVFDGSAAANLTAASMSDPRCTVSNYGQTTADVAVTLPTAAANLSCLFNVGTAQSGNKWGVRANTNDKIYLIAAAGTIAAGDDNGYARMTAAQVGQSFACWSFTTGSGAYDWQCKAISIGSSTFAAN